MVIPVNEPAWTELSARDSVREREREQSPITEQGAIRIFWNLRLTCRLPLDLCKDKLVATSTPILQNAVPSFSFRAAP